VQTPFTVPAGSILSFLEQTTTFNQDVEIWLFLDNAILTTPIMANSGLNYLAQIAKYSTQTVDPTAQSSHTIDPIVINRGLKPARGGVEAITIIETL
jgi:hypothetical protein